MTNESWVYQTSKLYSWHSSERANNAHFLNILLILIIIVFLMQFEQICEYI